MGETLGSASEIVETVGLHLGLDMADVWQADDCLFELLRDREVLLALVGELAGAEVAAANAKEKAKGLKTLLRDCLNGTNGRTRQERFVPKWMAFPPSAYTQRGGVRAVQRFARVAGLFEAPDEPLPEPPAAVAVDGEATVDIAPSSSPEERIVEAA